MRKNCFLIVSLALLLTTACEKEEILESNIQNQNLVGNVSSITVNGETDGVSYSLQGIAVNPNVIAVKSDNARIESSEKELSDGTIRLSQLSEELASSLAVGKILYVKTDKVTVLKKITEVNQGADGAYLIKAERAQLGEVFNSGTLDVSVDLYKAGLAKEEQTNLRSSGLNYSREIVDLQDEYNLGSGIKFNPSTNIKMLYNMKLAFSPLQILPSEFSSTFELQMALNPMLHFEGSINKLDKYELSQYIPQSLLDYIKTQEFEIKIPINLLGIDSLPAKIKIKDIQIPLEIEANLSNATTLEYGLNGSVKTGFKMKINGLTPNVTAVYENTLVATNPSTSDTYGELLTNAKIIITPEVSLVDFSYSIDGDITLQNKTSTYGNFSLPNGTPVFGSQGTSNVSMNVLVDLFLIKVPVNIINQEFEQWNIGTIVKSVTYSDLRYVLPSSYTDDYGLIGNILKTGPFKRTYKNSDLTLNYKYPILGKKIPDELIISYDIFAENKTTKLASVQNAVVHPTDITANSFKFKQDLFFSGETTYEKIGEEKKKIGLITVTVPVYGNVTRCQSKSYIGNIVIKDNKGYEYSGIYNTSKGIVENQIEIVR